MIFDTTQVPIQEPLYVNGHLSQVWHMFFLRLSQVVSIDDQTDLAEITQIVHQLPAQATQNQMLLDLNVIKGSLGTVSIPQIPQELHAPLAIVPSSEILNDSI